MEGVKGQCLICEKSTAAAEDHQTRTSQLDVFFVLRKVVEVPDSLLLKFLEESAVTRPDLCDPCQVSVRECRAMHEQLCELQDKWNHCKTRIANKVKETTRIPPPQEDDGHSSVVDLRKETTRFVMTRVNAFPEEAVGREPVTQTDPTPPSNRTSSGEEERNAPLPIEKEMTPGERPTTDRKRLQRIPRERSHPCPRCPKKYVSPYLLQRHLLAHPQMVEVRRARKQHKCGDCDKEFSHQVTLLTHRLIHTGEKPHECQLCHKRFRLVHHLNRHLKAHLGEKYFKCEICGKALLTNRELIQHWSLHTGEKPFECHLCPQAYNYQSQLSAHKKMHVDDQVQTRHGTK